MKEKEERKNWLERKLIREKEKRHKNEWKWMGKKKSHKGMKEKNYEGESNAEMRDNDSWGKYKKIVEMNKRKKNERKY